MKKIICIIPIKHISTRVYGKNFRLFNNHPLMCYIIKTLLSVELISQIVIDTNSGECKQILKDYFQYELNNSKIVVYNRPQHLESGETPVNVLLENVISSLSLDCDFFIQTHVTNPLLRPSTIEKAIEYFVNNAETNDSLFSVKKIQTRLYRHVDNKISAINHDVRELIPTQNLQPIFEENSCIYMFTGESLFKNHHRIGQNPLMFIMDDIESSDIDVESDFVIAETIHSKMFKNTLHQQKVCLITGVMGGLGKALSKWYSQNNWYVIGTDKADKNGNEYIDDYLICDLSSPMSIKSLGQYVTDKYERLDVLINNAALQICDSIFNYCHDSWSETFKVNLFAVVQLSSSLAKCLKKSLSPCIINVGSVHSRATSSNISMYASSKAALAGVTRNMAIEYANINCRVNCICPGAINTQMLQESLKRDGETEYIQRMSALKNGHLLNDIGNPDDIAKFVFDVSENKFINGENLYIDGGVCIRLNSEK